VKTVSVIIPTYNRADLVGAAVESVLKQTYTDFEVIVVDDGSQDNTSDIIRAYSDSRIRYFYQDNAGLGAARNTGIELARGDFLSFLDSDDLLLPEKLGFQVSQFEEDESLGFVSSGYQFIEWNGQPVAFRWPWILQPHLNLETILYGCPIVPNAVLVRTSWVRKIGGFNNNLRRAEDFDLWSRLAAAGCSMDWSPAVLCAYRLHPGQMVRDGKSQKEVTLWVLGELFKQPDLSEEILKRKNAILSINYMSGAFREYGAGQVADANESVQAAVALDESWLENEGQAFKLAMLSWAVDPLSGDPAVFVDRVLTNLPDKLAQVSSERELLILRAAVRGAIESISTGNIIRCQTILVNALNLVNNAGDYLTNLCEWTADCVRSFPVELQQPCLEHFFDHLPPEWNFLKERKGTILARLFIARGFEARKLGKKLDALRNMIRGIKYDPNWLKNRGVISIILRGLSF